MTTLTEFSLEQPFGPYESWPLKSRLLRNGFQTIASLPGDSLLHQFRTEHGFLFITDDDCPFEEETHFTWCDADLQSVSHRSLGCAYGSFMLERVEWLDSRHLLAVFSPDDPWIITIRSWHIPLLFPRLKLTRAKLPLRLQ